jgi:ethanolamine utilization protein EutQ (cupin superfamily)
MSVEAKNLERPDERREFSKGYGDLVHLGELTVGRGVLEPGWRWSNDIRPVVGTTSCEFDHTGVMLSGTLHVEMDDGTTLDINAGDVYRIPPGHDAWVVGDEPVKSIDWSPRLDEFGKTTSRARESAR